MQKPGMVIFAERDVARLTEARDTAQHSYDMALKALKEGQSRGLDRQALQPLERKYRTLESVLDTSQEKLIWAERNLEHQLSTCAEPDVFKEASQANGAEPDVFKEASQANGAPKKDKKPKKEKAVEVPLDKPKPEDLTGLVSNPEALEIMEKARVDLLRAEDFLIKAKAELSAFESWVKDRPIVSDNFAARLLCTTTQKLRLLQNKGVLPMPVTRKVIGVVRGRAVTLRKLDDNRKITSEMLKDFQTQIAFNLLAGKHTKVLSLSELAKMSGMLLYKARNLVISGEIPGYKEANGNWRVLESEYLDWAKAQES